MRLGSKKTATAAAPARLQISGEGAKKMIAAHLLHRVPDMFSARGEAPELEASGGITWERMPEIAKCGVDCVSLGALTHSVKAVDFSFLLESVK